MFVLVTAISKCLELLPTGCVLLPKQRALRLEPCGAAGGSWSVSAVGTCFKPLRVAWVILRYLLPAHEKRRTLQSGFSAVLDACAH